MTLCVHASILPCMVLIVRMRNGQRYDEIAKAYADFYSAYAEVIQRFPHEDVPMGPSLWKTETERDEVYNKVFRAYQKMAELPEDLPEDPLQGLDNINLS